MIRSREWSPHEEGQCPSRGPQGTPSPLPLREDTVSRQLSMHQEEGPRPTRLAPRSGPPASRTVSGTFLFLISHSIRTDSSRVPVTGGSGASLTVASSPHLSSLGRSHGSLGPVLVFATSPIPLASAICLFAANREYVFLHERESKPKLGAPCRQAGTVW